ncbi:hypothetical protein BJF96_g1770 [Verticillium dahliae]|uniref:Uncharacterized protein n=1 Tax=Verticillium dahliae TaxID=27337 RepID=A0AA45AP86_VERDA|nr:hypothetical protein BJF96_g1770 [Verticillium dahliae]PNH52323.1 hypothetical protein VD0003_g5006 [Verticillium dahliae]
MKLSIATTITLLVALATATLRGLGGECRKANDCCPCDTGSKRSLGCVLDATSTTHYRCQISGRDRTWCSHNPGQCGDWSTINT